MNATAREKILFLCHVLRGLPYIWGGNNLRQGGLDCSGGVQFVLARAGVEPWAMKYLGTCDPVVPAKDRIDLTAQGLSEALEPVPAGAPLEAGDLEFYGSGPRGITHVMFVTAVGGAGEVLRLTGQRNGTKKCVDVAAALRVGARWDTAEGGYRRDVVCHCRPWAKAARP